MRALFTILFACGLLNGYGQVVPKKGKIDSIAHQIDPLKIPHFQEIDSAKNGANQKLDSINGLGRSANHLLDSLSPSKKLDRYTKRIDSVRQTLQKRLGSVQSKLTAKVDSLKSLKLPTDKVEAQIKSLQGTMDSLQNSKPIKDVQKAEAKLNELQTKYSEKVSQIETKVNGNVEAVQTKLNSKLNEFSNGQVAGVNVDKLKLPDAKLPQLANGKMPNVPNAKIPDLPGSSIQGASIPSTGLPANTILKVPGSGLSIPGVQSPNLTMPGAEQLKDIQGKVGEVSKISGEANKYSEEVKNISKGNLENTKKLQTLAESQVDTKEMRKLQGASCQVPRHCGHEKRTDSKGQGYCI
jgi:hypothetical protein